MGIFEPQHSFEHIDELCYRIGPRLAGSERSQKSAEYIEDQFEEYGLKTRSQKFDFVDSIKKLKIRGLLLSSIFIASFFLEPLLALPTILAGIGLSYKLDLLMPKDEERNVIGTIEPEGDVERRIIVGAHFDTAKCMKNRKWSIFYRFMLPAVIAGLITITFIRFFTGGILWTIPMTALGIPFLTTCLLPFWLYENLVSPGADDNASGVSIMLEAARAASENPPEGTEIRFVGLGAEEQGLAGSKDLVRRTAKPDIFLNLDSIGGGEQLAFVEGTGTVRKHRTSEGLNAELAEETEISGIWRPLSGFDHLPFSEDGVESTTLTSYDPERDTRLSRILEKYFGLENVITRIGSNLHTLQDLPEEIRLENIRKSGEALMGVLGVEEPEDLSEESD